MIMADIWNWLTGRERTRQEQDAKQEAREHPLAYSIRDTQANERKPIQRVENEPRPGERMWPQHAGRQREMHDHPPEPKPAPEQECEATRMEYTRTAQPAPSMGGSGIVFTNSRVQQQEPKKDWSEKLLEEAREQLAKEPDIEQELSRPMEREQGSRTRWN